MSTSSSSSKNETQNYNQILTFTANDSDNGIFAGGDVTTIQTDQGAVKAGVNVATSAIEANEQSTRRVIDANVDVSKKFGENTVTVLDKALDFASGTQSGYADVIKGQNEIARSAISEVAKSTRSDSAVGIMSITKYLVIGGVVIAGILIFGRKIS